MQRFLKYPCENEAFAMINLARVAPLHCANNIYEIMRNRYDFYDNSYQELVKADQQPLNDPNGFVIETVEGPKAVDDLIDFCIKLQKQF